MYFTTINKSFYMSHGNNIYPQKYAAKIDQEEGKKRSTTMDAVFIMS